jgi:hypothetical protein
MNRITKTTLISLFAFSASQVVMADDHAAAEEVVEAATECVQAGTPIIPDGNVASKDELIAAQKAYKDFDATTQSFRECLLKQKEAFEAQGLTPEELEQKLAANLAADNAAVDQLVGVAEEFNKAVRAFKARSANVGE